MIRNTPAIIAIALLVVAVALQFLWFSSITKEATALTEAVVHLKDSLAFTRNVVDTLKARRPGLGEYMSIIQLHVAKLWFAAHATNWQLAKYEHGEMEETMEIAEALHAKENDVDVSAVLQSVRMTQLLLLDRAIAEKNLREFDYAYNETLAACNNCHGPAGYSFIHIIPPTREPVVNQQWQTGSDNTF